MRKGCKAGVLLLWMHSCFAMTALAADKQGCLVRMIDNLNVGNVLLESRATRVADGAVQYTIISEFASQTPWAEQVTVPRDKDAPIITGAGVPELSIGEIRDAYLLPGLLNDGYAAQDGQLTWIVESGDASCSEDDLSLIIFMVHEWFFFG